MYCASYGLKLHELTSEKRKQGVKELRLYFQIGMPASSFPIALITAHLVDTPVFNEYRLHLNDFVNNFNCEILVKYHL